VSDISPFPDSGTIQIDQELMHYYGKQSAAASSFGAAEPAQAGLLLNVQRGVNGTTPALHQGGAMVILVSLPPCLGDCDNSGMVTVDELLTMVNIALGNADESTCDAGDANHDDQITIDEILTAVNNALNGCGA